MTEARCRWRGATTQLALCQRRRLEPVRGIHARLAAASISWSGAACIAWSCPFASGRSVVKSAAQFGHAGAAAVVGGMRHGGHSSTTEHSTTVEAMHSHLVRVRARAKGEGWL